MVEFLLEEKLLVLLNKSYFLIVKIATGNHPSPVSPSRAGEAPLVSIDGI